MAASVGARVNVSRLMFLDKEYSSESEVFKTLLAVPHFSKVAGES